MAQVLCLISAQLNHQEPFLGGALPGRPLFLSVHTWNRAGRQPRPPHHHLVRLFSLRVISGRPPVKKYSHSISQLSPRASVRHPTLASLSGIVATVHRECVTDQTSGAPAILPITRRDDGSVHRWEIVAGRRPHTATAQPQTVPNPASVPWVTCLLLKCLYFPVFHENVVPIVDHSPAQPLTEPAVLVEATAADATAWGLSQPRGCWSNRLRRAETPLPASSGRLFTVCSPGGRDSSLGSTLLP